MSNISGIERYGLLLISVTLTMATSALSYGSSSEDYTLIQQGQIIIIAATISFIPTFIIKYTLKRSRPAIWNPETEARKAKYRALIGSCGYTYGYDDQKYVDEKKYECSKMLI